MQHRRAVQSNRQTLIDDTTTFINNNYTGIGATCERDLGLIIDAVSRDLILGTDFWTIAAGNSYLRSKLRPTYFQNNLE